ncbi:hypothetical protein [Lysinibacillus yapensis]|nr:hypothetical protein [Lysinibacillus yapensis]
METSIEISEKKMNYSAFQFILPFSIKSGSAPSFISALKNDNFERFQLDNPEMQHGYYGKFSIHHADIEHSFFPFINKILFPPTENDAGFQRYSRSFNLSCSLIANKKTIPFTLLSADVVICPYELAFLTIRAEITDFSNIDFSTAIEFGTRFRVLEPGLSEDVETTIEHDTLRFGKVENFIFNFLLPEVDSFIDKRESDGPRSYSIFDNKRMFVQSLFCLDSNESIEIVDVYRAGNLDGLDGKGNPYISSSNSAYIHQFVKENGYEKWAPNTYYTIEKQNLTCLTNQSGMMLSRLASQMYGKYYYGLLLNLFHRIVLLKIDILYSEVNIVRDEERVEKLIHFINTFTANYLFIEITTQSQGHEIFWRLRNKFKVETLYNDARQALNSLYKYQESFSSRKNNLLLLILTLYTVVGGIYGMNQVIEDLKGNIDLEKFLSYSVFEYIALFVTLSGLVVSIVLGVQGFIKWRKEIGKIKKWEAEEK